MKRFLFLFTLIVTISELSAQEAPQESAQEPAQETGAAAASSVEATQNRNWQNWVFAGSALVTVTAGVVLISLNSGSTSH